MNSDVGRTDGQHQKQAVTDVNAHEHRAERACTRAL